MTDDKVDGAAQLVGYLPGGGQRDAAVGAVAGALVARVGGAGNAESLGKLLRGAVSSLAAQALECSFGLRARPVLLIYSSYRKYFELGIL